MTQFLVEAGDGAIAVDLPGDDDTAGLPRYAELVVDAIGERSDVVRVAGSLGGFTAPIVCERVPVRELVLGRPRPNAPRLRTLSRKSFALPYEAALLAERPEFTTPVGPLGALRLTAASWRVLYASVPGERPAHGPDPIREQHEPVVELDKFR